ncbi:MAG TPA: hypothetical protein VFN64_01585 [Burkholderiaceae bacterium]|nr:hypothetical protein [Burkholderiaceae bacterium]
MKKDPSKKHRPGDQPTGATPNKGEVGAADHRVAQRHHKQSQFAQLSAANVEESPHMDRGDSAEGAGESLSHGRESGRAGESSRRGALDPQYGTKSSTRTSGPSPAAPGTQAGAEASKGGDRRQSAPNPGSSEESSGTERDTMTGPRPGSGS